MPAPDLAAASADRAIPLLLEEHGGKLYQLGLRVCGDPDEAEELVQETFLQAWRKWDQFEGRAKPSTWLYTIASRACWRKHRRRAGEPAHHDSLAELGEARSGEPATPADDPHRRRERREAVERVDAAIASLPLPYRLPLVLKEIAELKISEVAEVLDMAPATVKTRVHRARMKLREALVEAELAEPANGDAGGAAAGDGGDARSEHQREICLDLLAAKQESLDRGVSFPFSDRELCSRCASVFRGLDLARGACAELGRGELPAPLRHLVLNRIREAAT